MLAIFHWDPMYFLFVGPAMLLAIWAQIRVKSAYARASQIPARSGVTGAETAQRILNAYGINNVAIEPVHSFLGDHYDPRHKVLRLSPDVYHGRSLAALGIAAHEVGHAIQDAKAYGPLKLRNGLVPMASIGSNMAFVIIFLGMILSGPLGGGLVWGGIGLFSLAVLFQLINLPVEFDASKRAKEILFELGFVGREEAPVVSRVLSAAAMTYVAATISAVMTLAYYVWIATSRRD